MSLAEIEKQVLALPEDERRQFAAWFYQNEGKILPPPPAVAYGWAVESDQGPQYVAVKGERPADSPLAAVRVWLVSQARKHT